MGSSCCTDNAVDIKPLNRSEKEPLIKSPPGYKTDSISSNMYCFCKQELLYGFLRLEEKSNSLSYPIPTGIYEICLMYYLEECLYIADTDHDKNKPAWMKVEHAQFYLDLADFISILPLKSKQHIWGHSVKIRKNGTIQVLDKADEFQYIEKLMCDNIVVYLKVR